MNIVFLLVIYLAFISLGLPDTLLGPAWPVMRPELGVSLDAQGLITLIVSLATILSCLMNDRIVRRLGTAKITALSGLITAVSLLGYSQSPSYLWLPLPHGFYYVAMICIGVGCAPIFPSMIHLTPSRFGRRDSQRVMGVQMAAKWSWNEAQYEPVGADALQQSVPGEIWRRFFAGSHRNIDLNKVLMLQVSMGQREQIMDR